VLAEQNAAPIPISPIYLNCMAATLAENGRYPEAVETATRALTRLRSVGGSAASVRSSSNVWRRIAPAQPCGNDRPLPFGPRIVLTASHAD